MSTDPPISIVAVRARRSVQRLSMHSSSTLLPLSSTIAIGVAETPCSVNVTICNSGKARPMPSASTTGSPVMAADDEWDRRVKAARLGAEDRADLPAEKAFELLERDQDFIALRYLLNHHRRRAHHGAGHDEFVVGEVVDIHEADRTVLADRLLRHQLADIGIAAAARAEDGSADGDVVEIGDVDEGLRGSVDCVHHERSIRRKGDQGASSPTALTRTRVALPGI